MLPIGQHAHAKAWAWRPTVGMAPEEPFATPFVGEDGVYLVAFERRIPSDIQPLEAVLPRVTDSLRRSESRALATAAGRAFEARAQEGLAGGKSLDALATEGGLTAITLTNFSRATPTLPELGPRLTVSELLRVAADLEPGSLSEFTPAADGGFLAFRIDNHVIAPPLAHAACLKSAICASYARLRAGLAVQRST